jgi:hypothetical protein
MTTSRTEAEDMGAPSQDEIAAFQQVGQDAQMEVIRANFRVAEAQEALALAQADLAKANTVVARVNVQGAELQHRVQFSREATSRLLVPGKRG